MNRSLVVSAMLPPYYQGGAEKIAQLFIDEYTIKQEHPFVLTHRAARQGSYNFLPVIFGNICSPKTIVKKWRLVKLMYHLLDLFNPILCIELVYQFRSKGITTIYAHNTTYFGYNILIASKLCGIKYVQIIHDYYLTCVKSSRFKTGAICHKTCATCTAFRIPVKSLTTSMHAVFVSQALQKMIEKERQFKSSRVIYNPAQPFFEVTDALIEKPKVFTLGYLGAISENKGILQFLKLHKDSFESSGVNILIGGTGQGPYFETFLKFIASCDFVYFLGQTTPKDFFPRVKFLLVPSLWHEPLATVILESMSHATPCIANLTGGSPEMIDHGQTGYCLDLFDSAETEKLWTEILSMNQQSYQLMSRSAKEKSWTSKQDWINSILNI